MSRETELMDALSYLISTSQGEGEAVARAYLMLKDALERPDFTGEYRALAQALDAHGQPWMDATGEGGLPATVFRMAKDAARGRHLLEHGEWLRFGAVSPDPDDRSAALALRLPYEADLSCLATRADAVDAAIEAHHERD